MSLIFLNITSFWCHARSPRKIRGVRERRGVGNTKNSVHFPRGVHEARQKHAPCVGSVQKQRSITTDVNTHETLQKVVSVQHEINCLLAQNPRIQNKQETYLKYVLKYVNKKFEPSLSLYTVVYKSIYNSV